MREHLRVLTHEGYCTTKGVKMICKRVFNDLDLDGLGTCKLEIVTDITAGYTQVFIDGDCVASGCDELDVVSQVVGKSEAMKLLAISFVGGLAI